jgi:hypothetical protein
MTRPSNKASTAARGREGLVDLRLAMTTLAK